MEKKNGMDLRSGEPGSFAAALRKYRMQAGFSQREVATILRMNRSTYTYYETGKTAPDPETLNRIAKIFGVSMETFFDEAEAPLKLSDSGQVRKRANKVKRPDPQRVGDLTTEEKQIIAYLRAKGLSAEAVLRALQKRFDRLR